MPPRTGRCFPKILLHLGGGCFSREWSRRHEFGRLRLRDRTHEKLTNAFAQTHGGPFATLRRRWLSLCLTRVVLVMQPARHNGDPTLINHCIHQPGAHVCFSGPMGGREKMSHHRPGETKPQDPVHVCMCVCDKQCLRCVRIMKQGTTPQSFYSPFLVPFAVLSPPAPPSIPPPALAADRSVTNVSLEIAGACACARACVRVQNLMAVAVRLQAVFVCVEDEGLLW